MPSKEARRARTEAARAARAAARIKNLCYSIKITLEIFGAITITTITTEEEKEQEEEEEQEELEKELEEKGEDNKLDTCRARTRELTLELVDLLVR
ncbi:hypothetical protein BGZ60DRAFT_532715 [Tricladium varicosporioides]|nr:hypothetical protein BGZ60DRAFT_532715 [Hymenoscyphus varicosporioides]